MIAPSKAERSEAGAGNMERPGSDLAAALGMMLRDERRRLGQTQRDVAARARTSAATISRIERGDPHVRIATVGRISTSLGIEFTFRFSRRGRIPTTEA